MMHRTFNAKGSTALDMRQYIGRKGEYGPWWSKAGELVFEVEVIDVKDGGWGRLLYLIQPVSGHGSQWVTDTHLQLKDI